MILVSWSYDSIFYYLDFFLNILLNISWIRPRNARICCRYYLSTKILCLRCVLLISVTDNILFSCSDSVLILFLTIIRESSLLNLTYLCLHRLISCLCCIIVGTLARWSRIFFINFLKRSCNLVLLNELLKPILSWMSWVRY